MYRVLQTAAAVASLLAAAGVAQADENAKSERVSIAAVDFHNRYAISTSINYGAQIGACFIMLVVILTMTPTSKLSKTTTLIHMAGLVVCTLHLAFLANYTSPITNETEQLEKVTPSGKDAAAAFAGVIKQLYPNILNNSVSDANAFRIWAASGERGMYATKA